MKKPANKPSVKAESVVAAELPVIAVPTESLQEPVVAPEPIIEEAPEPELETEEIQAPAVEEVILTNQLMIMRTLAIVMHTMAGNTELGWALENQVHATKDFLADLQGNAS